jgi:two-component sensor histidine kinase
MTITQVIRLLKRPIPTDADAAAALSRLEALAEPIDWPPPETTHDEDLLTAATALFLQPARAGRAKRALRIALGGEKFELLVGFMTFVRSAHYWTLMHPEIELEDDVKNLLREHQELARLLLEDTDAGRCEMGVRLFEELESLRDLHERQELEKAKRALEESGRQKDLLMKEVDHRIKNSLQIVSSLLLLQARTAGAAARQFQNAAARVTAIAAIHELLHKYDFVDTVPLDGYLTALCRTIATASSSSNQVWSLKVDADPLIINTDQAVPLALIEGGDVHIALKNQPDAFSISVSDAGSGFSPVETNGTQQAGFGTLIVEALARQVNATVSGDRSPAGYTVTLTVPHYAEPAINKT